MWKTFHGSRFYARIYGTMELFESVIYGWTPLYLNLVEMREKISFDKMKKKKIDGAQVRTQSCFYFGVFGKLWCAYDPLNDFRNQKYTKRFYHNSMLSFDEEKKTHRLCWYIFPFHLLLSAHEMFWNSSAYGDCDTHKLEQNMWPTKRSVRFVQEEKIWNQ